MPRWSTLTVTRKSGLQPRPPGRDFEESVVSVQTSLKDFSFDHYAYVSSCDVYPDVGEPALNDETTPIEVGRQSHYGFHKLIAEQVVRHHVKTWMILRLGGLIGEGLKKGPIYDLVHGAPLRVHIDSEYQYLDTDVAAAVLFSLAGASRWNEVFNVAGVGTVSLRDVARSIGCMGTGREATGRPERYHINIDKIRRLYRIPDTGAAVSEFLSRGGSSA